MTGRSIGVEVTRSVEDLVDDLMDYRNTKVENGVDFPGSYKARVYAAEDSAEDAFYNAFADSRMQMVPAPGTPFERLEDLAEMVEVSEDAEVPLKAKPEGFTRHVPTLQDAVKALQQEGYDLSLELRGQYTGPSVKEAVEGIESEGVMPDILLHQGPQSFDLGEEYYTAIRYHPGQDSFEFHCEEAADYNGSKEEKEELLSDLEEALQGQDIVEG